MKTPYAFGLLAVVFIAVCSETVYAEDEHRMKAVRELEKAVASGEKGNATGVVSHTEEAKKHLIEANKKHPYTHPFKPVYGHDPKAEHDKETFEEMGKAISEAKKGRAKEAGEAAKRASIHLKEKLQSK